jgi:hypothetical protein
MAAGFARRVHLDRPLRFFKPWKKDARQGRQSGTKESANAHEINLERTGGAV